MLQKQNDYFKKSLKFIFARFSILARLHHMIAKCCLKISRKAEHFASEGMVKSKFKKRSGYINIIIPDGLID